jgi:hypothetical protein
MAVLAGEVIARFETRCPLAVQTRGLLAYALSEEKLNALFGDVAQMPYEKGLLFSTTITIVTREHAANAPWEEAGTRRQLGRIETGMVHEQPVRHGRRRASRDVAAGGKLEGPAGRRLSSPPGASCQSPAVQEGCAGAEETAACPNGTSNGETRIDGAAA